MNAYVIVHSAIQQGRLVAYCASDVTNVERDGTIAFIYREGGKGGKGQLAAMVPLEGASIVIAEAPPAGVIVVG